MYKLVFNLIKSKSICLLQSFYSLANNLYCILQLHITHTEKKKTYYKQKMSVLLTKNQINKLKISILKSFISCKKATNLFQRKLVVTKTLYYTLTSYLLYKAITFTHTFYSTLNTSKLYTIFDTVISKYCFFSKKHIICILYLF